MSSILQSTKDILFQFGSAKKQIDDTAQKKKIQIFGDCLIQQEIAVKAYRRRSGLKWNDQEETQLRSKVEVGDAEILRACSEKIDEYFKQKSIKEK